MANNNHNAILFKLCNNERQVFNSHNLIRFITANDKLRSLVKNLSLAARILQCMTSCTFSIPVNVAMDKSLRQGITARDLRTDSQGWTNLEYPPKMLGNKNRKTIRQKIQNQLEGNIYWFIFTEFGNITGPYLWFSLDMAREKRGLQEFIKVSFSSFPLPEKQYSQLFRNK
jgi:hypothetical protein